MPVSRMVELDGHRYLDGTTDSIPFAAALGLPDGKTERYAVDVLTIRQQGKRCVVTQDQELVKTDVNEQIAIRSQLYFLISVL